MKLTREREKVGEKCPMAEAFAISSASVKPLTFRDIQNVLSKVPAHTDEEILALFSQPGKRQDAFNLLVKQYSKPLYYHIRKLVLDHEETNDILQNCLLKTWENLSKFRGDSRLYTWLYRVATNEALTVLRKRSRQKQVALEDLLENGFDIRSTSSPDGDRISQQILLAIQALPEKQRVVFNLRYFDEMKYEEMSEILETSVGALKASYHHAVQKVSSFMTAQLNLSAD